MVRESVYAYPCTFITPTDSTAEIFTVFHNAEVLLILSIVGFFHFLLMYLKNGGALTR